VKLVESSSHLLMRCHLCVSRYFKYHEYLRECSYGSVMLSDVRDVYFQGDPFAASAAKLAFFLEDARMTIARCVSNSRWIRLAAPAGAALEAVLGKPIACSGTTIGTLPSIMRYLQAMLASFFRVKHTHLYVQGVDQGFHNWLVHGEGMPGAELIANGRWVDTLGYVGPGQIEVRPDGRIVGSGGSVCPVVHQYDRHPALRRHIEALV
jgi:hypothetical protein